MKKPLILCLDDQRDVLSAIVNDLEELKGVFEVVACESAEEALEELNLAERSGRLVALLICDHVMPELTGVEFLTELVRANRFPHARKVMLTGLATHEDTIKAINEGGIHYYLSKPWDKDALVLAAKQQLTHALFSAGEDYERFIKFLDQATLYELLKSSPYTRE